VKRPQVTEQYGDEPARGALQINPGGFTRIGWARQAVANSRPPISTFPVGLALGRQAFSSQFVSRRRTDALQHP
jgi:hypothetical protein